MSSGNSLYRYRDPDSLALRSCDRCRTGPGCMLEYFSEGVDGPSEIFCTTCGWTQHLDADRNLLKVLNPPGLAFGVARDPEWHRLDEVGYVPDLCHYLLGEQFRFSYLGLQGSDGVWRKVYLRGIPSAEYRISSDEDPRP